MTPAQRPKPLQPRRLLGLLFQKALRGPAVLTKDKVYTHDWPNPIDRRAPPNFPRSPPTAIPAVPLGRIELLHTAQNVRRLHTTSNLARRGQCLFCRLGVWRFFYTVNVTSLNCDMSLMMAGMLPLEALFRLARKASAWRTLWMCCLNKTET